MGLFSRIGSAIGGAAKKVVSTAKNVVSKASTAVKSVVAAPKPTAQKTASTSSTSSGSSGGTLSKIASVVKDVVTAPLKLFTEQTANAISTGKQILDATDLEKITGEEIKMGTLPLGPAGAVGTITKTATLGTGLKASQLTQQTSFIGKPAATVSGVEKIFAAGGSAVTRVAQNTKTMAQSQSVLATVFSKEAMILAGGWAGSVAIGQWGAAEAAEAITIPLRDALKLAEETGDWDTFNEYAAAAEELTDQSIWQKIALASPISAFVGIPMKIKGVAEGVQLIKKNAEAAQNLAEQREITQQEEKSYWDQVATDQAQKQQESEAYWENFREEQRQGELDEREQDAAYWDSIREAQRIRDLQERGEDEAYYAAVADANRQRKLDERAEDDAYWANINAGKQSTTEPSSYQPTPQPAPKPYVQQEQTPEQKANITATRNKNLGITTPQPQQQAPEKQYEYSKGWEQVQQSREAQKPAEPYSYKQNEQYQVANAQTKASMDKFYSGREDQAPVSGRDLYEAKGYAEPKPMYANPRKTSEARQANIKARAESSKRLDAYQRQPWPSNWRQIEDRKAARKGTSGRTGSGGFRSPSPTRRVRAFEKAKGSKLTPKEKKSIEDWNAGKSSLSFAWLKGGNNYG